MVSTKLRKLTDRIAMAVHAAKDPKAQRNGHARLGNPPGTYIVYKVLQGAPYTNTYKECAAEMGSSITEKLTVALGVGPGLQQVMLLQDLVSLQ